MQDLYDEFAGRYDLAFDGFDVQDPAVAGFFRRLFAKHEVHTVLDCACGTPASDRQTFLGSLILSPTTQQQGAG